MQSLVQNLMTASAMVFGNLRFPSMPILTREGRIEIYTGLQNPPNSSKSHLMLVSSGRREGSGTANKASRNRAGHG